MEIRRKLINECKGQPRLQKALAFALFLKFKLGRSSLLRNYSINKIRLATGISATTIKKYLPILIENGWVRFDGKRNQHLVVCNLASHTYGRNVCVDRFSLKTFKDAYCSLRAFLMLILQSHKDFIKRTIQIATNPKKGDDYRAARKSVKRLVRKGIINCVYDTYKEFGLSLKRIAKETGNCVRTAQRIVKYAISKRWVKKQKHVERVFAPKIYYRHIDGYTFSTRNNIFKVYANTYSLSKPIQSNLAGEAYGMVNISW